MNLSGRLRHHASHGVLTPECAATMREAADKLDAGRLAVTDDRVTDEMIGAGERVWGQQPASMNGEEISRALVDFYLAMHAARPVPEVDGDRVEAALDVWFPGGVGGDLPRVAQEWRTLMSRALAAADRNRAFVDWRRPEEWVPIPNGKRPRPIFIAEQRTGNRGIWYASHGDQLPAWYSAWAEVPHPPGWIPAPTPTQATTAPSHTDLMASSEAIDAFLEKHPPPDEPTPPGNGAVFTREKEALLRFLAGYAQHLNTSYLPRHREIEALILSAFPPAASWPPKDCHFTELCRTNERCMDARVNAECPHRPGQRAENGDG